MAHEEPDRAPILSGEALRALAGASFFRLAQLLEQHDSQALRVGSTRTQGRERVRFKANPTLGFPASEVASITNSEDVDGGLEIRLNLIGLYGPSSPLPTSYTERIVHAENLNALGDFLDLFNHRLAGLLYLVWRQYQHHVRYERGAVDAISVAIGALFGIPIETGEGVARDYRLRLIPYAGLLSLNNRSASSLSRVISHVFSVPCEIEEFVLRSVRIPDACLFALGERGHELGADTLIGEWLPDAEGCFRIWCGPIPFERYKAFLPNRADWTELRKLTDFVVPGPLDREYGFRIAAGTTPEWALGEGELGWTMWTEPDREATIEVVV